MFLVSGWNVSKSTEIDIGISQAVRDSSKISMTKNIFEGRVETTLTTEKASFKRNTTDAWKNYSYFNQQPYDFYFPIWNLMIQLKFLASVKISIVSQELIVFMWRNWINQGRYFGTDHGFFLPSAAFVIFFTVDCSENYCLMSLWTSLKK